MLDPITPVVAIKAASGLAKVMTAVVHQFSPEKRYEEASIAQDWMTAEVKLYCSHMNEDTRKYLDTLLEDVNDAMDNITIGAEKRNAFQTLIEVRKYAKKAQRAKKAIRIASDRAKREIMQQTLRGDPTSGQADVQSEQRTKPPQAEPKPRVTYSFVVPSGAPPNGPNFAMRATVEGDPDHLYYGTCTTQSAQTVEMLDHGTGIPIPVFRVTDASEQTATGGLDRGDSSEAAEAAATVHKPNTPNDEARRERDAPMDAADTYDRVSAKASPDGSSLDTPDEFIVFSRKVERVDLADWREIEHFVSVNHWEESK